MKKFAFILLACASLIAACACQPKQNPDQPEDKPDDTPKEFVAKRYN